MKRWPKLSERKSQYLSISRAQESSLRVINKFFEIVKNEYDKIDKESDQIIEAQDVNNCDEIGFCRDKISRKI